MKKIVILFVVCCTVIGAIGKVADDYTYLPMLVEGRTWTYVYHKVTEDEEGRLTDEPLPDLVSYTILGDTIIDGKACKKLYKKVGDKVSYDSSWYEEGKKVYVYDDVLEHFIPMYDFSQKEENIILSELKGLYSLNFSVEEDYVQVNGELRKRLYFLEEYDGKTHESLRVVEGIGGGGGLVEGMLQPVPVCICDHEEFVSCEEDGEVIFTSKDFNRAPVAEAAESIDLYGFITDTDGKGIEDATISYQREGDEDPWGLPVSTDADGFYSISVPNMSAVYTVSITAKGCDAFTETGLEVEENDSRYFNFTLSVVNGIDAVHSSESLNSLSFGGSRGGAPVYDLQGREVADNSQLSTLNSQLKPGIYIQNGKKFIVK